jgi:uncharacterized protein (TIGR00297 family)
MNPASLRVLSSLFIPEGNLLVFVLGHGRQVLFSAQQLPLIHPATLNPTAMPRHTISPTRDRLQSSTLVWIALPLLCFASLDTLRHPVLAPHLSALYMAQIAAISLAFAVIVWRIRAATPLASFTGGIICFLITVGSSMRENVSPFHTALTPLILLFGLTFAATRAGRQRKASAGLAETRKGRNAAQVIANLGTAAFIHSSLAHRFNPALYGANGRDIHSVWSWFIPATALAALAEATADTVSSEIGQAFGGTPRMILTLRPVPPGTDGAITLIGTLAGIAAAALVAASAIPSLGISVPQAALALAAGTAGLFFDSVLGATLERRGWIGNDLVNLTSTAFAAALTVLLLRYMEPMHWPVP